jgi:hypothetical protein
MREKDTGKKSKGVSLSSKDFTSAVGLGPGQLTVTESYFGMHDYGGKRKAVAAWFIGGTRNGDEVDAEPWTVGQGWKIDDDGQVLTPKAGQNGLPNGCKAAHLLESLEAQGMPSDYLKRPEDLIGVEMTLMNKPLPKIEGRDMNVLVAESVESAPWEENGKRKAKVKAKVKAKPEADDDDDDDDDDEPVRGKGKKKPADDDDDDEDEAPAKGKTAARGKGKPEPEEDEYEEDATEALIALLEDGPVKLRQLEAALLTQLKGNKQAKAIAAYAIEPEFLEKELGWTFNGKVIEIA